MSLPLHLKKFAETSLEIRKVKIRKRNGWKLCLAITTPLPEGSIRKNLIDFQNSFLPFFRHSKSYDSLIETAINQAAQIEGFGDNSCFYL